MESSLTPKPVDEASMADLIKMYTPWFTRDLIQTLRSYQEAIVYNEKRVEAIKAVLAARGQSPR